ncbi:hypothetical protein C2S52_021510 [Perilla frutescens var. hirtella]|nr:hypothetical protein C2S52_021510 [Perilla frutescens var. hirtella]
MFPPSVTKNILSIPISSTHQEDCIQWIFTKDGHYSVKSGYWTVKKLKDVLASRPSSYSHNSDLWNWFWSFNVPPKIKLFIWRCMRGILQTKSKLMARGLDIDPFCSKCGKAKENLEHVFRDCEWSSFFWEASIFRLQISAQGSFLSIQDWILLLIKNKSSEFLDIFVMLLWSIWRLRNHLEFQQHLLSHQECFTIVVLSFLADYQANNRAPPPSNRESSHCTRWSRPPLGLIKLNSDVSLDPQGSAGLGGVIRNHNGTILNSFSGFLVCCNDIEIAKAIACL